MSEPLPYWYFELDGALPERVRCTNCCLRFDPSDLSRAGLCERCDQRERDGERELFAESMRRP